MATLPNPGMPPQALPEESMGMEPAPMDEPEPEAGGVMVCIFMGPDGELSVGQRPATADEAADFTPAEDRKDALTQALEILKSDGNTETQDEQDFNSGLSKREVRA